MTISTHRPAGLMFFLLVLALAMISPSSQVIKGSPLQEWHVRIVNKMSRGHRLFIHCKSKDDDLGKHDIRVGAEFSWGFKTNYWGTTLFWCYMRKDIYKAHASFNVFWSSYDDWLSYRCDSSDCIWTAKNDGIYLRNVPQKRDELVHKWQPGQ
ncbi:hypothetical protein SLA2020_347940 [Shorea laevis]